MAEECLASIIIPTYNGAERIKACLDALSAQVADRSIELLVVDDGSTDDTRLVVYRHPNVRYISQTNAGPAAARNHGAAEAHGDILLFTDDDCVPTPNWLSAMLAPFDDPKVVGVKGVYRTHQRSLIARFVQIEYEGKYRLMANLRSIDFVDTYSAAFRRDSFLEMDGYDTSFPVACAEDIDLSYRMSARNWTMRFAPDAVVFHTHPNTLLKYLSKKYKFAFWRVLAVRKNPAKGVKDSHTPQLMKLQILLIPALITSLIIDFMQRPLLPTTLLVLSSFYISTVPFVMRALKKDIPVGLLSPALLAARACVQFLGLCAGLIYASRKPILSQPGLELRVQKPLGKLS